jgi:LysM repeat protein
MKNIFLGVLFIFFLQPLLAQVVIIPKSEIIESHDGKSYYVHTVHKGQTIYSIAKVYEVTPDEIYFENPNSKDGINLNQILLIPTVNKETELKNDVVKSSYDFFYHVASNNETFDHISSIYLIPVVYLIKANPNLHSPLREGEYVKVPVKEAFDILDGKVTATVSKPSYRKTSSSSNNNSSNISKTQNNNYSPNTNKVADNKPKTETVSFNPKIPVIQDYRHVVILGENTSSIALKYGISVELLKSVNPGLGNTVVKGDRLRVPDKNKLSASTKTQENVKKEPKIKDPEIETKPKETTSPIVTQPEIIVHKVKKKETLYSIGREYGVTVSQIIDSNPGLTPSISIGQLINIPKKKISKPYIIHVVNKRTKTSKIAKLYRIPVYQLNEFNPTLGKRVYKNNEIKIPVGSKAILAPVIPDENVVVVPPNTENIENTENDITDVSTANCSFLPDSNTIFKVALMIPLSLEEADSINRDQFLLSQQKHFIPFRFIHFYEGALIALDSLTKQGMKVEMTIYDVDKNLTKTAKVLQNSELRHMNLIIGPFYNNSFNQVALFAGNFNIPIVNPLSYRDAVVNNYSSVIKVKPTNYSQSAIIQTFINKFANNSKVFLISQTSYIDADNVIEINNGIMSLLEPQTKFSNQDLFSLSYDVALRDTLFVADSTPPPFIMEGTQIYPEILENTITDSTYINNYLTRIYYATDSLHPFLENASPLRNNLVILYGNKKSFILDVLNRLNESRDTFDIQLVGMPTWDRISNLSNIKMNNLNLSYFSSKHIDYNKITTQDFIYKFRSNYNAEPNDYAFSGFDITYYFLSALYHLGDNFNNCLEFFPMDMIETKFQFRRISNTNNFENDYWNMLQLKNMSLIKIPDELILQQNQQINHD